MATIDERLDAMVEKDAVASEQIKQFLTTNRGKSTEIEVYGLKLNVPAVIPKKIRHDLAKIQKKGGVEIEEAEQDTYYLLSLLCQPPFNVPEVWEVIDDETGLAMDILGEVLEKGYQTDQKLKSFRGRG